ncbi:MAG TPA: STAS domain-containing protein [Deinococcales bacterium]|nr:STAS domain-containing protein [Deinococcales bacterium]
MTAQLSSAVPTSRLASTLASHHNQILEDWTREQVSTRRDLNDSLTELDLREHCAEFLQLLRTAAESDNFANIGAPEWAPVLALLGRLSRDRGLRGSSPSATASFVLSIKRPLFARLGTDFGSNAGALLETVWTTTDLLDRLGLYTTEVFQAAREEVIARQHDEMLELSTPVVRLWDGILALPMIGTLDSSRTQVVMEALLTKIVETESDVAIIDITGVPVVDTLVAQHLLKTVTAARLMGADCIISGMRPQIAQTIVHLGIDLGSLTTRATLKDAFKLALSRRGTDLGTFAPAAGQG